MRTFCKHVKKRVPHYGFQIPGNIHPLLSKNIKSSLIIFIETLCSHYFSYTSWALEINYRLKSNRLIALLILEHTTRHDGTTVQCEIFYKTCMFTSNFYRYSWNCPYLLPKNTIYDSKSVLKPKFLINVKNFNITISG